MSKCGELPTGKKMRRMHSSETDMSAGAEFEIVVPDEERLDDDEEEDETPAIIDDPR